MNVYICSTVRHFLFAVLKSCQDVNIESRIYLILDQQDLNVNDFNFEILPNHIVIIPINRKEFLKEAYSGLLGSLIKFYACIGKTLPKKIRDKIVNQVFYFGNTSNEIDIELYLFNDRNRVSKFFRTFIENYSLIEDGIANYSPILKKYGFLEVKRVLGQNKKCKNIFLLNPRQSPLLINDKVKKIDFINVDIVKNICFPLFKVSNDVDISDFDTIIATQPTYDLYDTDLEIYSELLTQCEMLNYNCVIKVHPREDELRYTNKFPNVTFVNSKIPLELILFSNRKKSTIYSLYSSAGMGFDDFCIRKLILNEEWIANLSQLKAELSNNPEKIKNLVVRAL
ncbi:TPA: glycosyltransferase family 52 [Photobacterium damselae]